MERNRFEWLQEEEGRGRDRRMESGRIWRMEVKIHCKSAIGLLGHATMRTSSCLVLPLLDYSLLRTLCCLLLLSSSLISRIAVTASSPCQFNWGSSWTSMLSHHFILLVISSSAPLRRLLILQQQTQGKTTGKCSTGAD